MTNLEELKKMEARKENADRAKVVESAQECVVKNNKVRILNTVNRDVGSNDINNTVDTHDIIRAQNQTFSVDRSEWLPEQPENKYS